jgi:gas vesicle protein
MNRLLLGVAVGAALVYFFDSERGETRRMKASNWISQYVNADTVEQAREQARQATHSTMQQARSLTGQVSEQVSQLRSGRRATTPASNNASTANNATKTPASAQN